MGSVVLDSFQWHMFLKFFCTLEACDDSLIVLFSALLSIDLFY
jgi:hypothetical protein